MTLHVVSVEDAAGLLGVSEGLLRKAIKAGELPALGTDEIDLRVAIAWRLAQGRRQPVEKAIT